MSRHRSPDEASGEFADTAAGQDEYDRDVAELIAASTRLREIGEQVDEAQRAAITLAVDHAVHEAERIADQRSTRNSRRGYRMAVIVAAVIALAVSLPFAVTGYLKGQEASNTAAQLVAGDAASAEVTNARASALLVVRRDFANANAALVAAGLSPVPDPGTAATAYQISIATGEALGTLRAAGELEKRGVAIPGVNAPDPTGGRFPDLKDGQTP